VCRRYLVSGHTLKAAGVSILTAGKLPVNGPGKTRRVSIDRRAQPRSGSLPIFVAYFFGKLAPGIRHRQQPSAIFIGCRILREKYAREGIFAIVLSPTHASPILYYPSAQNVLRALAFRPHKSVG
jgi:hypothetical protein